MKRYHVNDVNEIVSEVGKTTPISNIFLKTLPESQTKGLQWAPGTATRWEQEKAKGYFDPTVKTTFSLDDNSVLIRSANLSTILAALQTGAIRNADSQKTWDIRNKEIILTTGDYVALLIRMGSYYRSLYEQYAP
jgi:hypothetical protein